MVLSRVPTSMSTLLLLLAVGQTAGSLGDAGLAVTGHALALAAASSIAGRLTDRWGARTVLVCSASLHAAAATGLLACLMRGAGPSALVAAAALLGATTPPGAPVTRQLWPALVPGDQLRTAHAFDSITNSAAFIAGPALAGALTALTSTTSAITLTLVLRLAGSAMLATAVRAGQRQARGHAGRSRRLGPLAHGQIRLVLTIVLLDTASYGCAQVAAVALTRATPRRVCSRRSRSARSSADSFTGYGTGQVPRVCTWLSCT